MSLDVTFTDLQGEVGHYLAIGTDTSLWSSAETDRVKSIIKKGLRQYYGPPPTQLYPEPHEWRFMKPVHKMRLQSGVSDFDLPEDYEGIEGPITFDPRHFYRPIKIVGEQQIRMARQDIDAGATGVPQYAAVRAKTSHTGKERQRWEILVYPEPASDYDVEFVMRRAMPELTSALPYPVGGPRGAGALIASCIAAAELDEEDRRGERWQDFETQLMAAIRLDKSLSQPEYVGQMNDPSDEMGGVGRYSNRHNRIHTVRIQDYPE